MGNAFSLIPGIEVMYTNTAQPHTVSLKRFQLFGLLVLRNGSSLLETLLLEALLLLESLLLEALLLEALLLRLLETLLRLLEPLLGCRLLNRGAASGADRSFGGEERIATRTIHFVFLSYVVEIMK